MPIKTLTPTPDQKIKWAGVKKWWKSKTIIFFLAVMAAGGLELLEAFVKSDMTAKDAQLFLIGIVGIALRINTYTSVKP